MQFEHSGSRLQEAEDWILAQFHLPGWTEPSMKELSLLRMRCRRHLGHREFKLHEGRMHTTNLQEDVQ